jgi:CRP/FNR family cyclic AMP-dependent transcriptional regulator
VDREQVLFRLFGKYCPAGTILCTEGSPGQELYFIQSGAVRLGAVGQEGGRAGLLGPGDLLGEGSFFVPAPRSTRAEVVQDTRLIQINERTLDAVVRHGPQTSRSILEQLLAMSASAGGELALWTIEQLLRRIASDLTAAAGVGIVPAQLAEHAGLVESDVLLVLEELRRRGCLVCEGSVYRALDVALLQREIEGFAAAGGRA